MSFADQEQALLDLVFDRELRAAFRRDGVAALARYGLSAGELADFATVRPGALEMDAAARVNFILAQYCRQFPLTFVLASSLPPGLDLLRRHVDAALMRVAPAERLGAFGIALRDGIAAAGLADAREQALVMSIVEAELGMAWTAQLARQSTPAAAATSGGEPPPGWLQLPLTIAPLTSAAVLPRPYAELKAELCPCTGAELWRRLGREPLTPERRRAVLGRRDLRLLVARAAVVRPSPCEPEIEHVTVELGEGFARLLPHVDGRHSVATLLAQLRTAGADELLLDGVTSGFRRLWEQGMLQAALA
ncbi:MAG: hypothetical protein K0S16_638 [Moraxellaceae bacterium]|jgi:hypothetical protein|nr:hypothetical protein [Moraxellaceae bacterium]